MLSQLELTCLSSQGSLVHLIAQALSSVIAKSKNSSLFATHAATRHHADLLFVLLTVESTTEREEAHTCLDRQSSVQVS